MVYKLCDDEMGKSEWGVRLQSKEDARAVWRVVLQHNQDELASGARWDAWVAGGRQGPEPEDVTGETLTMGPVLRFRGGVWLAIGNRGGETAASKYLHERLPGHIAVQWPFHKEAGWRECRDYLLDGPTTLVRVLALPELEAQPPRATRRRRPRLRDPPPITNPRTEIGDAFRLAFGGSDCDILVQRRI